MSNSKARKGQSLEQSMSETLEPMSHCASDCVACHSSHRLLYDQTHVLCGSLVFMEPHIDLDVLSLFRQIKTTLDIHCYGSVQIDRSLFSQGIDWAPDRYGVGPVFQSPYSIDRQIRYRTSFLASLLFRLTETLHRSMGLVLCFLPFLFQQLSFF